MAKRERDKHTNANTNTNTVSEMIDCAPCLLRLSASLFTAVRATTTTIHSISIALCVCVCVCMCLSGNDQKSGGTRATKREIGNLRSRDCLAARQLELPLELPRWKSGGVRLP